MECKQIYNSGVRVYLLDNYNLVDFVVLSLYLSSYALRFLVDHWIKEADAHYNGTQRAKDALITMNYDLFDAILKDIMNDKMNRTRSYFMQACKHNFIHSCTMSLS